MKPRQLLNSTLFLFICFCMLVPTLSLAQKQPTNRSILLKNGEGKEITIKPGQKLRLTLNDGSKTKGQFKGFDGNHLSIGKDSVEMADVTQISTYPTFSQIGGAFGMGLGSTLALSGTALMVSVIASRGGGSNELIEFLMGAILVGVAVPSFLIGLILLQETNDYKLTGDNAWEVVKA